MNHDHKLKGLKEIKILLRKEKVFLRNMSVKLDMEEKLIEEMKELG